MERAKKIKLKISLKTKFFYHFICVMKNQPYNTLLFLVIKLCEFLQIIYLPLKITHTKLPYPSTEILFKIASYLTVFFISLMLNFSPLIPI